MPRLFNQIRDVAQPGSVPAWGAGGRWFESSRPDRLRVAIFFNVVTLFRAVAQPGSALRSGRRGRWFESSLPDRIALENRAFLCLTLFIYYKA